MNHHSEFFLDQYFDKSFSDIVIVGKWVLRRMMSVNGYYVMVYPRDVWNKVVLSKHIPVDWSIALQEAGEI